MLLVKSDNLNQIIKNKFAYTFNVPSAGLYLLEVVASARSWWQNFKYVELWVKGQPKLAEIRLNLSNVGFESLFTAKVLWQRVVLRQEPRQDSATLIEISKEEKVVILEKAVLGQRPTNESGVLLSSDRWHRVEYQKTIGYIYSEALEIIGEDPAIIERLILDKAVELGEDGCLMLAIAKQESRLFPYAVSDAGACGLFQLMEIAIEEVNRKFNNDLILVDKKVDIDQDGYSERFVILSDIPTRYTSGITKSVLIKKNGTFIEISRDGSGLQWWKIGDFNGNGRIEIAVFYGYRGSGGFGQFYVHEWASGHFTTLLSKEAVNNDAEFKDLDGDGIQEIVYSFSWTKWGKKEREVFRWDGKNDLYLSSLTKTDS